MPTLMHIHGLAGFDGGRDFFGSALNEAWQSMSQVICGPFFVPRNALFRGRVRRQDFQAKTKPAKLAGLSVKSLVALPSIE